MRNQSRSKETLKLVIINLWISYKTGIPIKYSRDRNRYLSHKRYGRLHIKYKRLIPIIETLEALGFVHQKVGFFDREKKKGKRGQRNRGAMGEGRILNYELPFGKLRVNS